MKKIFFLGAAAVLSAFTAFSQCTTGGADFGTTVAPCSDTGPISVNIAGFEVWRGDLYNITDVQAGADYSVDICQGTGGTAWPASLTVVAPSGAVEAFGLDAGSICELSFTASESGDYQLFINEVGECPGVSQSQDNGVPRVNYFSGGVCGPISTVCEGGVTDQTLLPVGGLCPGDEFIYAVDGISIPTLGSLGVDFEPVPGSGTGGLGGAGFGLSITGIPAGAINDTLVLLLDNFDGAFVGIDPLVGEWTITTVVDDGSVVCATSDPVVVDYLTPSSPGCVPVTACEAGILDQAGIDNTLCPEEATDYNVTGVTIPNDPLAGEYLLIFAPVPGSGAGGPFAGDSIFLTLNTPAGVQNEDISVSIDAQLLTTGAPQIPLTGEWIISGGILTDVDPVTGDLIFCDNVPAVTIDFLDENAPECGGVVPCELPYPAVDNASLAVVQNANGSITFSWEPINGQIGCQVNARVGDPAAPTVQTSIIVGGATASSFTASQFALAPYPFQNINFRVRCGCQQNPTTIAGPYSSFVTQVNIPPGASAISTQNSSSVAEKMGALYASKQPYTLNLKNNVVAEPTFNLPAQASISRASKSKKASMDIFPNPSEGAVNVNYSAKAEGLVNVRLFDVVGKAVADFNFAVNEGANFLNMDLSSFEKGIYVIEVLEGDNSTTSKVVLQ